MTVNIKERVKKNTCKQCKKRFRLQNFTKYTTLDGVTRRRRTCTQCRARNESSATKNKRLDRLNTDRHRRKELIVAYLGGKCSACKGVFPSCCYDFHHINEQEKETNIGWLINSRVIDSILYKEVDKCRLLCSNCHRIHHWGRRT